MSTYLTLWKKSYPKTWQNRAEACCKHIRNKQMSSYKHSSLGKSFFLVYSWAGILHTFKVFLFKINRIVIALFCLNIRMSHSNEMVLSIALILKWWSIVRSFAPTKFLGISGEIEGNYDLEFTQNLSAFSLLQWKQCFEIYSESIQCFKLFIFIF